MTGSHPAYADMPEDSIITNGFWLGKSAMINIEAKGNVKSDFLCLGRFLPD